ncbi:MAG: efflux RND transporter periplasmic adaptor subunit [Chloroflexi bacterium]|nr:efflux RND transporter periplasmic adaptor subunit [Chloroflexota bacterium]
MKVLRLLLVVALVAAGFGGGFLVARRGPVAVSSSTTPAAAPTLYRCPMHPHYTSDKPGSCPICGMTLVPVDGTPPPSSSADPTKAAGDAPPPGTIRISADRQQLIGVSYGTVSSEAATRTIRAVGSVAVDETRITKVHTRVDGWIDSVHADFTGKPVVAGQRLLTLYSPDLLNTQEELLLAIRQQTTEATSVVSGMSRDTDALVASARRRLQLWSLTDAEIDDVIRTKTPIVSVPVSSPATGYVLTRNAYKGQRITPDTELYTLADLRRVWILAEVFEADAQYIRLGMLARVTMPYGDHQRTGRVTFIQPQITTESRTLKVRIEVDNPGQVLKPDMYVNAEFDLGTGTSRLVVPTNAVLDSGTRQVVFVDRGEGYLEPRDVQVAERLGDRIVIASGLALGERIVTSGTFLIDSEAQLKAAAGTLGGPHQQHGGTAPGEPAPPATPGAAPPAPDHSGHPTPAPAPVPAPKALPPGGHVHD